MHPNAIIFIILHTDKSSQKQQTDRKTNKNTTSELLLCKTIIIQCQHQTLIDRSFQHLDPAPQTARQQSDLQPG